MNHLPQLEALDVVTQYEKELATLCRVGRPDEVHFWYKKLSPLMLEYFRTPIYLIPKHYSSLLLLLRVKVDHAIMEQEKEKAQFELDMLR